MADETKNVVKRAELKQLVDAQLATIAKENEVVIVGARNIIRDKKNNVKGIQLELAQSRRLRTSKPSLLALANKGDERFSSNTRTIFRFWLMVTKEGAMELFGLDLTETAKACESLKEDEIFVMMQPQENVMVDGVKEKLTIVVNETSDIAKLPKSIRESVEAKDEYADQAILQARNRDNDDKLEAVVDAEGKQVYRWTGLGYGEVEDQLVDKKSIISNFIKENNTDEKKADKQKSGGVIA